MDVLNELREKKYALEAKRDLALQKVWCEVFGGVLPDEIFSVVSEQSLELKYRDEDRYWRTLCDVYYYHNWRDYKIDEIKVSHSSGGGKTQTDFNRMMWLGEVGKALSGIDVKSQLQQILDAHNEEVGELDKAIYDLEKAERERKEAESARKWNKFVQKVETQGVCFAPDVSIDFEDRWSGSIDWKKKDLPSMNVRFNDEISQIAWIRIVERSASGKTCTIETKHWRFSNIKVPGRSRWSEDNGIDFWGPDYVDDVIRTHKRVKIEYVWDMLRTWKDKTTDNIDEDGNPFYLHPSEEEIAAELKKYDDFIAEKEKPVEAKPAPKVKVKL